MGATAGLCAGVRFWLWTTRGFPGHHDRLFHPGNNQRAGFPSRQMEDARGLGSKVQSPKSISEDLSTPIRCSHCLHRTTADIQTLDIGHWTSSDKTAPPLFSGYTAVVN